MDAPVAQLCELVNASGRWFTTSSCSGRVSVFAEPDAGTRSAGKKGGEWVFVSHERVAFEELRAAGA